MKVVGVVGFEPTTDGLRDRYSTAELHPQVVDLVRFELTCFPHCKCGDHAKQSQSP